MIKSQKFSPKQISLSRITSTGKVDGRSLRWQKSASYSKLVRQGQFGGAIAYRCSRRPLYSGKALHVVLKSAACAGVFKFTNLQVRLRVEVIVKDWAKKKKITLYKVAIVSNHIHLLLRVKQRELYIEFIRALSSDLASKMKKWAKKLNIKYNKFWENRPYSRIVHFGKHFQQCLGYLEKNTLEALGFVAYAPRNHSVYKTLQKIALQNFKTDVGRIHHSTVSSTA